MRILLDECVPKPLKRKLKGHHALTVTELGWAGKTNGQLLSLMASHQFAAFLTSDRQLQYQQNLRKAGVTVIVVSAGKNRLSDLLPLVPKVLIALKNIKAGDLVSITA
jgi:hypothetical protein